MELPDSGGEPADVDTGLDDGPASGPAVSAGGADTVVEGPAAVESDPDLSPRASTISTVAISSADTAPTATHTQIRLFFGGGGRGACGYPG
ncbi:hypothetical protein BHQ15_10460 [Mycolicibacillus koreensis]|nr:hypothetical protein BHQ15_10460 [Mycolicibacillus koreensis]